MGSSLIGGSWISGVGLFLITSTLLLFTTCSSFGSGWVNTSNKSLPFSPLLFSCFFFSAADTFLVLLEFLVVCSSSAPPTPAFLLITSTKGLQSTAFSSTAAAGLASSQGESGRGVGDTGSYRGSSPLMPSSVVTLSVSCTCFIGTADASFWFCSAFTACFSCSTRCFTTGCCSATCSLGEAIISSSTDLLE